VSNDPRRLNALTRRLAGDRAGAVALEFALLAPVLIVLILGIVETGRALWVQNAMQLSVEEGARFALANPAATDGEIIARARAMLAGLNTDNFTYSVTTEDGADVTYVTVSVTHSFRFFFDPRQSPAAGQGGGGTLTLDALSRQPRSP